MSRENGSLYMCIKFHEIPSNGIGDICWDGRTHGQMDNAKTISLHLRWGIISFEKGHAMVFLRNFIKTCQMVSEEKNFKAFQFDYTVKICFPQWPCFSTVQNFATSL